MYPLRFTACLAVILVAGTMGCTSYRIIRYREPDARNQGMFAHRAVRKADAPFVFARATVLRDDLDTVTVRSADVRRISFGQYLTEHAVLAFVVIRRDTIVYERYRDGFTASTIHTSFSVAKSVLSALVGIAVGEGKIRSLDDAVSNYVPELRGRAAFEGVTVRHLLDMKSGLRFTETGDGPISDFRSDEARIFYTSDLLETIRNARRERPPGTKWTYKDIDAELLGVVLSRATGQSVAAYTEEKLWRRIGTEHDASWDLDHKGPSGQEKVSSGFNATALDFARIGRLYLEGGRWGAEQIVPAEWVARSVAVDPSRTEPEISVWWQMQHTMYWWHPIQPPAGEFFADGSHGQRIYVDPATRTIVVQLANRSAQDFPFRKVVAHLTGKQWEYPRSIPALLRQAAINFGVDSIRPVFDRLSAARRQNPEGFVITQNAMNTAGTLVADDQKTLHAGIAILRIATELYPRSASGWIRLSDAYLKAGNAAAAKEALERARELSPDDPEVVRRLRGATSAARGRPT
jgi:CubicO group peptidase (beta-lactamase class C family)